MDGGTLLCIDDQLKREMVYRATEEGFGAHDFHRCSDEKGPIMTIIQSKDGKYLIGGYTEISWTTNNTYKADPSAFLFTLTNPHGIQPTKFLKNPKAANSVGHAKHIGAYFGGVVKDKKHLIDIQVTTDANMNLNSRFDFPSSYIDTTDKGEILFTRESRTA